MDPHEKDVEKVVAAWIAGEISENHMRGQIEYTTLGLTAGEIRDRFDTHQETCESCGLDTGLCPPASELRRLYVKMNEVEADGPATEFFVVYDKPQDFPTEFVVRAWRAHGYGNLAYGRCSKELSARGKKIEDVRRDLLRFRPGLVKLDRAPDDDLKIVEVWA